MKALIKQLTFERLLPRFFTGCCMAAFIETALNPYGFALKEYMTAMSTVRFLIMFVSVAVAMTVVSVLAKHDTVPWETAVLVSASFLYLGQLAFLEHNFWFSLCLVFVMLVICLYALQKDRLDLSKIELTDKAVMILIGVAAAVFTAYSALVTVCRYKGFISSTFDLGIFSQMFYYMKETGLPLTTCERDGLLSHFAVHVSPIWYLLLPGYFIFPSPVYLQIMQAVILASGVVPLYLLCKHTALSKNSTLCICLCYCFFPALTGGQFYDTHENLFLAPLLLWLCYFYEKKTTWCIWLFAALTFLVKEDAAIYVACFALYALCSRKDVKNGLPLFLASIVYFFAVTALLSARGDGVMTSSRFWAYLPEGSNSMVDVLKTVFFNPAFLFEQVFTVEKVRFLLLMLLPVACLPFFTKKISSLLLLVPMLVVNVMPNWEYQYSIHFQYVFGSIALIIYLTVINVKTVSAKIRRFILPFAVFCAVLLSTAHLSQFRSTVTSYFNNIDNNKTISETLSSIPEDASVVAHGFYLPAVSQRKTVYDLSTGKQAEYIVIDLRPGYESDGAEKDAYYAALTDEYECIADHNNLLAVYRDVDFTE